MKNKFHDVMNAHSDEQLVETYTKRSQYTDEAIEAMEIILKKRGLLAEADKTDKKQQEKVALSEEEIYNEFQCSEFGRIISDADFVKEKTIESDYRNHIFQRNISPLHNHNWLNHLFIILGIIGTVLTFVIIGIGEFEPTFTSILTFSVPFAALLPLGILKLRQNKAQISILKNLRKPVLRITGIKDDIEMSFPIRYVCYWDWNHIKLTLKQVELTILLFDDNNNTVIELRQLIELHKSAPPHWGKMPNTKELKALFANKTVYAFLNHGTQKPFLYELQKILNGLNESFRTESQ